MLKYFLESLTKKWPILPVIVDELTALECVTHLSGIHITDLDVCKTGNFSNIFLYEKAEDKKHLSIVDVRRFLDEISLIPYSEKALYVLRGFDTATIDAMNASLKILEEPPEYAIILLVVENPEGILETIRSRTITLFRPESPIPLSSELSTMIEEYSHGNTDAFIGFLYQAKYDTQWALGILMRAMRYTEKEDILKMEQWIIELFGTNENPRNILDRVFLTNI